MIHVCFSEQPRRFGKLSDRHSKVNDAQTYEIKTKISATKQVTRTVTGYLSLLQGLWQEIDHYQCIQMHCCEDLGKTGIETELEAIEGCS